MTSYYVFTQHYESSVVQSSECRDPTYSSPDVPGEYAQKEPVWIDEWSYFDSLLCVLTYVRM